MSEHWDDWLGSLALKGIDPRSWDLNQLLAAFEAQLRESAKDEAAWQRTNAQLRAEPKWSRDRRRAEAAASGTRQSGGMSEGEAEALVARFTMSDAQYGR